MDYGPARTRRLGPAVVALALAATGTVATTASAGGCAGAHSLGHGWTLIDPPSVPGVDGAAGEGNVAGRPTDFTAVPGEPATLLVSDGSEIWRSGDAGCSWQPVYSLTTDLPASWENAPYSVAQFAAASPGPHGGDRVYALLIPGFNYNFALSLSTAPPTLVLASTDGGKTWTLDQPRAAQDLANQPRCLDVVTVSVSPADQKVIDLVCVSGAAEQIVDSELQHTPYEGFRSTDGGISWQPMNYPNSFGDSRLTADPYSPNVVWAVSESQAPRSQSWYLTVYRSADGGLTWATHRMSKAGLGPTWDLSVAPTSSGRTAVTVVTLPVAIYDSTDGMGAHWRADGVDQHVAPLVATGSFLPDQRDLLVTDQNDGCQRQLTLHRTTRRGASQFVRLPSQIAQSWTAWHYTGGPHPGIVGWTAPKKCVAGQLSSLLRYQP
jgi:hypothetical protein